MLIYSESRDVRLQLLSGGRDLASQLGGIVSAVLLDPHSDDDARQCFLHGAQRVYVAHSEHLALWDVEPVAQALEQVVQATASSVLLIGSTRRGRELAGRLAQKLQAGCITDAIDLALQHDQLVARRASLGGRTVASEVIQTPLKVFALKPGVFQATAIEPAGGKTITLHLMLDKPRTRLVEQRAKRTEGVDLEQAEVVVAVGRGLKKKEDLSLVEELAAALGGQLGCTRGLCCDLGWLSEERMIGISGKTCKPRLHVSVGISGQIQHAVGIQQSGTIIAINQDRSAPIFAMADYGIVGDLYQVVPQLLDQLRKKKGTGSFYGPRSVG